MNAVSLAEVTQVPIGRVVVGIRRREKLGRIQGLAKSIAEHGLIHPILLRGDTLVAGHRRLEACRLLNWRTIPARQVERMSDDELRAIELDENANRENLSDFATSKQRFAQIRQAEADLKAKAKAELSGKVPEKSAPTERPRGRPKQNGTRQHVADETGISEREQQRIERHVAIAEAYPFMQRTGWLRHHVLDAGDLLDRLPDTDRAPIAVLLDQDGIPPATALEMLTNAVEMPTARRAAVVVRAQSIDPFERRTAATMLAEVPPPPDPGLLALHEAAHALARAAKGCRSTTFRPRVEVLSTDAALLLKEFHDHEQEVRNAVV